MRPACSDPGARLLSKAHSGGSRVEPQAGYLDEPATVGLSFGVGIGLVLAVLYSAANAGLGALGDARIRAIAEGETGSLRLEALRCVEHGRAIRTRLLVGRVLSVSTAAGCAALLGQRWHGWLALGAATAVGLGYAVLAELGSTVARRRASKAALRLLRVLRPLELIAWPIAAPIRALGKLTGRLVPAPAVEVEVAARTVEKIIDKSEAKGEIQESQAKLLRSVLEFRDTVAREVMVPRTQVVAFDAETPMVDVLSAIEENGHSRYPVYRGSMDHVDGILYAKDVFGALRHGVENLALSDLVRSTVFFAPETQKISTLLAEMQARRFHLAVVVDEFGGAAGVVTLEDILEEIVGEIEDEHDDDDLLIHPDGPGRYVAAASISVYDLEKHLGEDIDGKDGDFDSLGGLLVQLAGRVPEIGSEVTVGAYVMRVVGGDDRHVERVAIRRCTPVPAEVATTANEEHSPIDSTDVIAS